MSVRDVPPSRFEGIYFLPLVLLLACVLVPLGFALGRWVVGPVQGIAGPLLAVGFALLLAGTWVASYGVTLNMTLRKRFTIDTTRAAIWLSVAFILPPIGFLVYLIVLFRPPVSEAVYAEELKRWLKDSDPGFRAIAEERVRSIEALRNVRVLPDSSGCLCMKCGRERRRLVHRELRLGIGFWYWYREETWRGYLCGPCAVTVTLRSLFVLVGSMFLMNLRAILRGPYLFLRNLWNLLFGCAAEFPVAFDQQELDDGKITQGAAVRWGQAAREVLNASTGHPAGILLGTIAVNLGYRDSEFIVQLSDAIRQCPDQKWVKMWRESLAQATGVSETTLLPPKERGKIWSRLLKSPREQFLVALLSPPLFLLVLGFSVGPVGRPALIPSPLLSVMLGIPVLFVVGFLQYALFRARTQSKDDLTWWSRLKAAGGVPWFGAFVRMGCLFLVLTTVSRIGNEGPHIWLVLGLVLVAATLDIVGFVMLFLSDRVFRPSPDTER